MTFIDAYNNVKKTLRTRKPTKIEGHLAIQLNLTDDEASGIMYIEVADGKLNVEPYDYYEKDAMFIVSSKDFIDIMNAKLDFDQALNDGTLSIYGNYDRALEIKTLIRKPANRKPAAQKAEEKGTEKKPAARKSGAKK